MAAAAADAESPAPPPPPAVDTPGPAPLGVGAFADFAVVCSFLERYGAMLDLPELSFPELEEALEETGAVAKPLMELHLKLMRKIGKSVTTDRWEKYLVKICQDYNSTWAWELEKKGYLEMSVECKVGMLKHLCECQFDDNLKFKNIINEEEGDAMRLQPIGRDKDGLMYWLQLDQDHNVRMYIEEQDDQDGSTWKCIVRTRNEMAETLELLKAQIDPALLKKCETQESSSHENPNPEDEVKKDNEEKSTEDEEIVKPDPEDESCKTLKTSSEIKAEPQSDVDEQKPAIQEEKDSFKENVKPLKVEEKIEPKEAKGTIEKIPPSQDPERSEISVIVKRTEDPVEKSLETEKIKNDHQAKIPLKKRELKLTDDFDNAVKTSLGKPVTPTKEVLLKHEGKPEEDNLKTPVGVANSDGKQLVNGDVNSEKLSHKTKADQVENSNARESVVVSTKDENGLLNEMMSTGVIKSLMVCKENKITSSENLEKNIKSHESGDVALSTEESSLVIREPSEVDLKNASTEAEDGESLKTELVVEGKEKMTSDKEASINEVGDTKPSVMDKPAKASKEDQEEVKDVPPSKTDKSNEDDKVIPSVKLKTPAEKEGKVERKAEAGGKLDGKKDIAVTAKSQSSKHSAAKSNLDGPSERKENAEDGEKATSESAVPKRTTEQGTSAAPAKRTKVSRTRPREKPVHKENVTSTSSESQPAKDEAADEEEKTSKTEKHGQGAPSRNRHLTKTAEEESNVPECKQMTSERQKDGLKLTIRISSKRKRSELPQQMSAVDEADDAEENAVRTLRRSPRISRPSAKVAEIKDRKPEKRQSDEEEEKPVPSKPEKEEERKADKDQCPKVRKKPMQRRRARWTNVRSRRRRKESSEEESEETDSEEDSEKGSEDENKEEGVPGEDDEPCKKCGLPNHPELILLCDSCDSGYHTACLRPPLMLIPDGEWFCPPCQHKLLCDKLDEQLQNLDVVLKKKERAERRKERLVYVGISLENIIPTQETEELTEVVEKEEKKKKKPKPLERRSTRARKCISYRFDEFDEAIDEAIEEDIRDAEGGGGAGRGKDMSNITGHRGKDISTILEGEKPEGKRPQRAVTRRKKRRRLNDLDSDSNVDDEESEDEFRISDGSEDEFVLSDENVPESDDDQQSNDSDFGTRKPRRHYRRPIRKSTRLKRRSTRRRYSDDDEDESDEEADESASDQSSDYSDDYLDTRRRRSRRNQKRQVNYREDSESDGSQKKRHYGRGKEMRRVLKRRFSSSDSSDDSAEEQPKTERKHLVRKRIRSSNDEASEEEAEKPVRKRLNRIDTDDEDEEEDTKGSTTEKPPAAEKPAAEKPAAEKPVAASMLQEGTKKHCYRIESDEDDDFGNVGKDGSPLDYSLVDLPSTNGQSPGKTIENLIGKPNEKSQNSKDTSASVGQASNGMGNNQEAAVPEEDEDELLRVTDLVDYVCNSEQL